VSQLAENCLEKYLKKLVGRTEIEDALKKLDKLTNEEARMATAQVLKVTHDVDNRVAGVDDKMAVVIDGAHLYSISYQGNILSFDVPRGKTG
jgi:hypothetical protein